MKLFSSSLESGKKIPLRHSKTGDNISPALRWTDAPVEAKEFALLMEDLDLLSDGEPFLHWAIYKIQPHVRELEEDMELYADDSGTSFASLEGMNSFGKIGYDGPFLLLKNLSHRYRFKLFALGKKLNLSTGALRSEFLKDMEGCVVAESELECIFVSDMLLPVKNSDNGNGAL